MNKKMKKWKRVICCLLVAALMPIYPIPAQAEKVEVYGENTSFRLATYNIAANQFAGGANQEKFAQMNQQFVDYNLEFVAFQEVDMFNNRNNYDMLAKFQNDEFPYAHFAKGRDYEGGDFGIGMVSKYDFKEASSSPIDSSGGNATKTCQRALIEKDDKEIAIYNVHLSYESLELRQRQIDQVIKRVDEDPTEFKIILGDFNTDQNLYEYSKFLNNYKVANGMNGIWFDTFNGVDSTMKVNTIDNIIVSKNIDIIDVEMADNRLSDHNMLAVELELIPDMDLESNTNIALGQKIQSSSQKGAADGTYSAMAAVDNDSDTMWQSETSGNEWIELIFMQEYDLAELSIEWGENCAWNYIVEVAGEGAYRTVYEHEESVTAGKATASNASISALKATTSSAAKTGRATSSDAIKISDLISLDESGIKKLRIKMNGLAAGGNTGRGYEIREIYLAGELSERELGGENVVINGGFELTEPAPTEQLGPANTYWDVDLWENDIKASDWIFQMYNAQANPTKFKAKIDTEDAPKGDSSVWFTKFDNTTDKIAFMKQMAKPVEPNTTYQISFWVKTKDIASGKFRLGITQRNAGGSDLGSTYFGDIVTTEDEWHYYTNSITTKANTSTIDIVFRHEHTKGEVWLDDLSIAPGVPIEYIHLSVDDYIVETGQTVSITPTVFPEHIAKPKLVWTSSNPLLASVDDEGNVTGLKAGKVMIHVTVPGSPRLISSIILEIEGEDIPVSEDYRIMQDRWRTRLVGDETLDWDNEYIKAYVEDLDESADELWQTLDKSPDREDLWDFGGAPGSNIELAARYTTRFKNINTMALAYGTKGSRLAGNPELYQDIVDATEFMVTEMKYNGSYSTSNWWDWQIGCAQPFVDTLMILADEMTAEEVYKYANCIAGYASDPSKQMGGVTATGANRTDIGISVLGTAILLRDDDKMQLVNRTIPDVFKIVTSGDGIYADGSVVQHTHFPYSGSYGSELMRGIGSILYIMDGTEWEIKTATINNVYETLLNGYIPLIHDGLMMGMVNGRSVSRAPGSNKHATEFSSGAEAVSNIMTIAKFAPEEYSDILFPNVKYWLEASQDFYDFYANARNLEALMNALQVKDDDSITAGYTFEGVKIYSMDRVVQRGDGYKFGLSMYSNRMANYEYGNMENKRGWNSGDGVLYLYNNDLNVFADGYQATIDAYRLPGTTADTAPRRDGESQGTKSPQSWVGGATEGNYGAVGMWLDKSNIKANGVNQNLKAKKSWFLLDGKAVALGADINGTTDASIETTVENRMLNDGGSNRAVVNGTAIGMDEITMNLEGGSWAHLEGSTPGADIGYYFHDNAEITAVKEQNTANYFVVNELFLNDIEYTKHYFKMGINHGQSVSGGTYAYTLLPGKSLAETESFQESNQIEIIRNDGDVQAIIDEESKVLAMNIWNDNGVSVNGFTVNKACSIVAVEDGGELRIAISYPKRGAGTTVALEIEREYLDIISLGKNIELSDDGTTFLFSTANMAGGSSVIVLEIENTSYNNEELAALIQVAENINPAIYTEETINIFNQALEAAIVVYENSTSQAEIDGAVTSLQAAIDGLMFKIQKELEEKLELIGRMDEGRYTTESWHELQVIVDKAVLLLEEDVITQEVLKDVYDELLYAYFRLELKDPEPGQEVDKEVLSWAISYADSVILEHYIETGKAEFEAAYGVATEMLERDDADKEMVDNAVSNLLNAISMLKLKADKRYLEAQVKQMETVNLSVYTEASAAVFQEALEHAKALLEDENLTLEMQPQINQAINKLAEAKEGLKRKTSSGSGSGSSGSSKPASQAKVYPASKGVSENWRQDLTGWRLSTGQGLYARNEWKLVDGQWYFFDASGYMATSWRRLDENDWYYMKEDGAMAFAQWIEWNDTWYYMSANGKMAVNTVTPDGYRVNSLGEWVK